MRRNRVPLAVLAVAVLVLGACSSRDDSSSGGGDGEGASGESADFYHVDDCATDPTSPIEGDTIKLVSSFPQSGLTSAFSEIARGWQAYFEQVNQDGGVEIAGESYQLEWEDADDEYNPGRTAENIEEMVGADGTEAFAVFSVVGTANNINIRDTLDELCVPNLFAATGSVAWGNPEYPWTIGSTLVPYTLEAQAFADYLAENQPDAKVAMLRQDDEYGETYQQGFEQAIEGTDIELVEVEQYSATDDNVTAQIQSLAASGADAFFNGATLLHCPNALTAKQDEGWEATTWVSGTCISKTLMGIAGAAGEGVISGTNLKDPLNPDYHDDPAITAMRDAVQEHQANFKGAEFEVIDGVVQNAIVAYGWTQAELLVRAMEAAEAPTRLAVMEAVRNMDGEESDMAHDGISFTTSGEDDAYLGESLVLIQYDSVAAHFVEITGDVLDFEGRTAELTPEDLITA